MGKLLHISLEYIFFLFLSESLHLYCFNFGGHLNTLCSTQYFHIFFFFLLSTDKEFSLFYCIGYFVVASINVHPKYFMHELLIILETINIENSWPAFITPSSRRMWEYGDDFIKVFVWLPVKEINFYFFSFVYAKRSTFSLFIMAWQSFR